MAALLYVVVLATAVLFVPAITAQKAYQSAWLATLVLPTIIASVVLLAVWKLGMYFPDKTLAEYSEVILGKLLGKAVAGSYALFFLVMNILVVREFAEFLTVNFMPETPIWAFCSLLVLVAGYAAYKGVEVIARMAQFILPLFLLTLLIVVLFTIPDMQLGRLQPLLEGGVLPIIQGSFVPASWYGEIVVLVMLLPSINKPQEVGKKVLIALLAMTITFTAVTFTALAVFGPYLTGDLLFPVLELASYVNIARFIQRLTILIMTFWVSGIVVKSSLTFYVICLTSAQVSGIKNYKYVLVPSALCHILGSAFLFANTLQLMEFLDKYWTPMALVFELVLPLLLWPVAAIRLRKRRTSK